MPAKLNPINMAKYAAARRSVDFVEDGMRVGLGSGSTAAWMVRCLGELVREDGLKITGVSSSARTTALAKEAEIPLTTLEEVKWLDLTIDGADEFDDNLNLIKGGGGAHLMEKIIATASDQFVVISDVSKQVETLGAFPLPIEVIPFGWQTTKALVEEFLISMDVQGRTATLRLHRGKPFVTDQGNYILDLHLRRIENPRTLSLTINQVPGVVENGLFLDLCDAVIIGDADGMVEVRDLTKGVIEREKVDIHDGDNIFGAISE